MRHLFLRLSAFTLLELVVTMAVSALLIGMAYAALHLVLRQQQRIHQRAEHVAKRSSLQRLLTVDFATASEVQATAGSIRCIKPRQVIDYVLLDSVLVRQQGGQVDTFLLAQSQATYYFQGQDRRQGVIDAVDLVGLMDHDTITYTAQAYYSAEQLMHFSQ